jgi:hypothetical protein
MTHRKARTIRGSRSKNVPTSFPIAYLMMVGIGCPDARAASIVVSGSTKTSGTRKRKPARVFRITVPTIAFGTCVDGC